MNSNEQSDSINPITALISIKSSFIRYSSRLSVPEESENMLSPFGGAIKLMPFAN